jgi:flagellar protein FlaG
LEIPKITSIQKSSVVDSRNNQGSQSQDQPPIESEKESPEKRLDDTVKNLNLMATQSEIQLNFKMYEKSGQYYVQMIDSKTNEVIREIPSKKILDYFAKLKEFLGLIVDKQI